jgi:hypothetical protein
MPLFLDPTPPGAVVQRLYADVPPGTSNTTTTSTYPTYATLLTLSITTGPNILQVLFTTCFDTTTAAPLLGYFRIMLDGTLVRGAACRTVAAGQGCALAVLGRRAVTAGSHTVTIEWAVQSGGTLNIETFTNPDIRHGALMVEEVEV